MLVAMRPEWEFQEFHDGFTVHCPEERATLRVHFAARYPTRAAPVVLVPPPPATHERTAQGKALERKSVYGNICLALDAFLLHVVRTHVLLRCAAEIAETP